MQITDQGFTERLGSPAGRVGSTSDATQGTSGSVSSKAQGGSSDRLQLSSFASLLQSAGSGDTSSSSRAARVNQLAQLVNSGNYQIDPSKISSAMVSEAVQSAA